MNVRTIAVETHRLTDLKLFMKARAQEEPGFFRRLARLGILPGGGFIVETTEKPLTVSDKEGLIALAEPTDDTASYVLSAQKRDGTRAIAVDNRARFTEPALAHIAAEIVDAIVDPFPAARGKIALAPGASSESYSFMGNGRMLTDMSIHGISDVVAVPENLGGGFVARSTRDGQRNALWYLTAKKAGSGHWNAGSWMAVASFEAPIVGIGLRFHGTTLIVTVEGQGLRVVDARTIAQQTVREVGQSETPRTIRALGPIAEADGPFTTGLFTTMGKGGRTETYFGRLGQNGLPADAAQLAAIA